MDGDDRIHASEINFQHTRKKGGGIKRMARNINFLDTRVHTCEKSMVSDKEKREMQTT